MPKQTTAYYDDLPVRTNLFNDTIDEILEADILDLEIINKCISINNKIEKEEGLDKIEISDIVEMPDNLPQNFELPPEKELKLISIITKNLLANDIPDDSDPNNNFWFYHRYIKRGEKELINSPENIQSLGDIAKLLQGVHDRTKTPKSKLNENNFENLSNTKALFITRDTCIFILSTSVALLSATVLITPSMFAFLSSIGLQGQVINMTYKIFVVLNSAKKGTTIKESIDIMLRTGARETISFSTSMLIGSYGSNMASFLGTKLTDSFPSVFNSISGRGSVLLGYMSSRMFLRMSSDTINLIVENIKFIKPTGRELQYEKELKEKQDIIRQNKELIETINSVKSGYVKTTYRLWDNIKVKSKEHPYIASALVVLFASIISNKLVDETIGFAGHFSRSIVSSLPFGLGSTIDNLIDTKLSLIINKEGLSSFAKHKIIGQVSMAVNQMIPIKNYIMTRLRKTIKLKDSDFITMDKILGRKITVSILTKNMLYYLTNITLSITQEDLVMYGTANSYNKVKELYNALNVDTILSLNKYVYSLNMQEYLSNYLGMSADTMYNNIKITGDLFTHNGAIKSFNSILESISKTYENTKDNFRLSDTKKSELGDKLENIRLESIRTSDLYSTNKNTLEILENYKSRILTDNRDYIEGEQVIRQDVLDSLDRNMLEIATQNKLILSQNEHVNGYINEGNVFIESYALIGKASDNYKSLTKNIGSYLDRSKDINSINIDIDSIVKPIAELNVNFLDRKTKLTQLASSIDNINGLLSTPLGLNLDNLPKAELDKIKSIIDISKLNLESLNSAMTRLETIDRNLIDLVNTKDFYKNFGRTKCGQINCDKLISELRESISSISGKTAAGIKDLQSFLHTKDLDINKLKSHERGIEDVEKSITEILEKQSRGKIPGFKIAIQEINKIITDTQKYNVLIKSLEHNDKNMDYILDTITNRESERESLDFIKNLNKQLELKIKTDLLMSDSNKQMIKEVSDKVKRQRRDTNILNNKFSKLGTTNTNKMIMDIFKDSLGASRETASLYTSLDTLNTQIDGNINNFINNLEYSNIEESVNKLEGVIDRYKVLGGEANNRNLVMTSLYNNAINDIGIKTGKIHKELSAEDIKVANDLESASKYKSFVKQLDLLRNSDKKEYAHLYEQIQKQQMGEVEELSLELLNSVDRAWDFTLENLKTDNAGLNRGIEEALSSHSEAKHVLASMGMLNKVIETWKIQKIASPILNSVPNVVNSASTVLGALSGIKEMGLGGIWSKGVEMVTGRSIGEAVGAVGTHFMAPPDEVVEFVEYVKDFGSLSENSALTSLIDGYYLNKEFGVNIQEISNKGSKILGDNLGKIYMKNIDGLTGLKDITAPVNIGKFNMANYLFSLGIKGKAGDFIKDVFYKPLTETVDDSILGMGHWKMIELSKRFSLLQDNAIKSVLRDETSWNLLFGDNFNYKFINEPTSDIGQSWLRFKDLLGTLDPVMYEKEYSSIVYNSFVSKYVDSILPLCVDGIGGKLSHMCGIANIVKKRETERGSSL
jgi:hypothetical protein